MIGIAEIARNIADLAYPPVCSGCKAPLESGRGSPVCMSCFDKIKPSRRSPESDPLRFSFTFAYSACQYEGVMKELIHSFKYSRKTSLAKLFSNILLKFISKHPEVTKDIDLVTFVPLRPNRLRERGFNQSKLLACGISGHFGLKTEDLLEKAASTKHQNELTREKRLVNLKGAFRAKQSPRIAGRRILLIDDVMTTGATFNECAKTLSEAGAAEVRCLALSRGI